MRTLSFSRAVETARERLGVSRRRARRKLIEDIDSGKLKPMFACVDGARALIKKIHGANADGVQCELDVSIGSVLVDGDRYIVPQSFFDDFSGEEMEALGKAKGWFNQNQCKLLWLKLSLEGAPPEKLQIFFSKNALVDMVEALRAGDAAPSDRIQGVPPPSEARQKGEGAA